MGIELPKPAVMDFMDRKLYNCSCDIYGLILCKLKNKKEYIWIKKNIYDYIVSLDMWRVSGFNGICRFFFS